MSSESEELADGTIGLPPERLSRPSLFMGVAELFGRRSSCPRADVGCIATLEGRIVASGYVGAPHGQPHCLEVGCKMENGRCVRTVHAEANLVAWSARVGTPLLGTTLWCTHQSCITCIKSLAQAGVSNIVWLHRYSGPAMPLGELLVKDYGMTEQHVSEVKD